MTNDERAYWVGMTHVPGIGAVTFSKLIGQFGSAKATWQARKQTLKDSGLSAKTVEAFEKTRTTIAPNKLLNDILANGIAVVTRIDEQYPKLLNQIYDPPVVLYVLGNVTHINPAMAIVGTRKMTNYGSIVTEKLTCELVNAGLTIVSGLARGIDSAAHRAAIAAGGRTIAVLGGGLNHIYPKEHTALAQEIVATGGAVISEFPPDHPAVPGNFPSRNRIISGLSHGVVVVEAAEQSGTMITVDTALEQNREVFAVPGPITSILSVGTMNLIKQGAKLVTCGNDILEEFDFNVSSSKPNEPIITEAMSLEESTILAALAHEPKQLDLLISETGLTSAKLHATLTMMELSGLVKAGENDFWYKQAV